MSGFRPRESVTGKALPNMLFSLSLVKVMVVLTLAFFLFGVPLMTLLTIVLDRKTLQKKAPIKRKTPHESDDEGLEG